MKIAAQVFGLGAMLSLFLIYQQKNRKRMIAAKLSADICWVLHYFFLGGTAGMIPNAVGILRELIFLKRKTAAWAGSILWPGLFILINWGLGLGTFHSAFNILPIAASTFVTISLWIDNPRLTKMISLPVSLSFMIYDIYIGSVLGVINETVAIVSIILYFVKERKNEKECIF